MSRSVLERPVTRSKRVTEPSQTAGGSIRVLWLPAIAIALLAAFPIFVPRVGDDPRLAHIFWAVSAVLLIFLVLLRRQVLRAGRVLRYEIVLNKVHYVQLIMHICVYTYWGWYWRDVYRFVPLLAAQIIFTYGFDMLVCWSRRDTWLLGFGPIPIVLSTNLFLWFRDDWFYFQFLMLATGVLGKEFIRWRREGRLTHIFNPSALSLFLFSIVLIATKSTGMTRGIEIADTLHRPPHIYLEIFFLGLIVQSLFRVTLVTLWSAAALYALNLWYTYATGDYNFVDSNIPVSVFLGLHLLVTDPATSPRRNFGKAIFGALYGAGVFGIYRLLGSIGAPEFYDKLLCVPILNLTVCRLDRLSDYLGTRFRSSGWRFSLNPRTTNFAWMGVWCALFITMLSTGFLSKGKDHPGGNPEHWHLACLSGQHGACETWTRTLNVKCQDNSASDCVKLGSVLNEGRLVPRNAPMAGIVLGHACDLGFQQGCSKLVAFVQSDGKDQFLQACHYGDGASCFVLGSLYSGGYGVPEDASAAFDLFRRSCDAGWWRACGRLGVSYLVGQGTAVDPSKAMENFEKGCEGDNGASCLEAAKLYASDVTLRDAATARQRFERACDLGVRDACNAAKGRK